MWVGKKIATCDGTFLYQALGSGSRGILSCKLTWAILEDIIYDKKKSKQNKTKHQWAEEGDEKRL